MLGLFSLDSWFHEPPFGGGLRFAPSADVAQSAGKFDLLFKSPNSLRNPAVKIVFFSSMGNPNATLKFALFECKGAPTACLIAPRKA